MLVRPCILALGLSASCALGQVLMNPSFEFGAPVNTLGAAPVGGWGWDQSMFVPATLGITPASGVRMLQFRATTPSGPSPDAVCRVAQVVDFTPMTSQINAGTVTVTFGALFNRRVGGFPVGFDNLFRVELAAYAGPTVIQPTNYPAGALAFSGNSLLADISPATWQPLTTSLLLPPGTTHVACVLSAVENSINNFTGKEFSGHFADNARMVYTPAPGVLALAAGPLLLAARRRRT